MKEKKVKVSRENWDYLVDKLQYILANYLHGGESDEVIAEFENLLKIFLQLKITAHTVVMFI